MELIVWVCTDKVGSKMESTIKIDDEDWEYFKDHDNELIKDVLTDKLFEMIEWVGGKNSGNYREKVEGD